MKHIEDESCHSYLSASTGFNFDALYAGTAPEIIPIAIESNNAKMINCGVTTVVKVHRIVKHREQMNIVAKYPHGMTNKIVLEKISEQEK